MKSVEVCGMMILPSNLENKVYECMREEVCEGKSIQKETLT